eukprot:TRINITY_DN15174_c1_g6_i1.p1 TRINITY_DN15174_c1_g6~~TRINITY_DN15174_c1_g6_i1.p1  ORF type:complete len:257 (+),score=73.27 TRINITY_DN15174_c1_g6_i1:90-860(+)
MECLKGVASFCTRLQRTQAEETARRAAGREPHSLAEKDLMIQNYTEKQQGLPSLDGEDVPELQDQLFRLGNLDILRLQRLNPREQADILEKIADVDARELPDAVDKLLIEKEDSRILDVLFERVIETLPLAPSTSFQCWILWNRVYFGETRKDILSKFVCNACAGVVLQAQKRYLQDGFSKVFSLDHISKELTKKTDLDWSVGECGAALVHAHRLALDDFSRFRWQQEACDGDETSCEDDESVVNFTDDEDDDTSG